MSPQKVSEVDSEKPCQRRVNLLKARCHWICCFSTWMKMGYQRGIKLPRYRQRVPDKKQPTEPARGESRGLSRNNLLPKSDVQTVWGWGWHSMGSWNPPIQLHFEMPGVSYLHRKPSAVDAMFRSRRAIAVAPVKFHLLCFESARQASTTDEIVIFQKDGNCVKWKRRGRAKWVPHPDSRFLVTFNKAGLPGCELFHKSKPPVWTK